MRIGPLIAAGPSRWSERVWAWMGGGGKRVFSGTRGFTLVEVLVVVGLVMLGAGVGTAVVTKVQTSAMDAKLAEDVRQVNTAIRVYKTGGGTLSGITDPQIVINKLKTVATTEGGHDREIMFAKGSMIDRRLAVVADGGTAQRGFWKWGRQRARYNPATESFDIVGPEATGAISGFALDETRVAAAPETERRPVVFRQARQDAWVWDFNAVSSPASSTPPAVVTGTDTTATVTPLTALTGAVRAQPPGFDPEPPRQILSEYPLAVVLTNPNNPQVSRVLYHLEPGNGLDVPYREPIAVDPGTTVVAFIQSLDPTVHLDSEVVRRTYVPEATQPQLLDTIARTFNYVEAGGALAAGSPASSEAAGFSRITLDNSEAIPSLYTNDSGFRVYWTYDGSDPRDSSTRSEGVSFFERHPGEVVPVRVSDFGDRDQLTLKYYAKSHDSDVFADSEVATLTIGISQLTLPAPVLSAPDSTVAVSGPVSVTADATTGVVPDGYRVFYTIDGDDPGDINGEPGPQALPFTGPIEGLTDGAVVVARVYPPADRRQWFQTSPPASLQIGTPLTSLYYAIGGNTRKIYGFDPKGSSVVKTSSALFPMACLAVDPTNTRVYYVEHAASQWRLGVYDVTTSEHREMGRLDQDHFFEKPITQLTHLLYFNDGLYYVRENSDDLIKIELRGDVIAQQFRAADLTADTVAFSGIGDIAADTDGRLILSSATAFASYDLRTMSGYRELATQPAHVWQGLVMTQEGDLLGVKSDSPAVLHVVNQTDGSASRPTAFTPQRSFSDLTGPQRRIPTGPAGGQHYFITAGEPSIYRIDILTGRNYLVTSQLPMQPTGLAIDRSRSLIYTIGVDETNRPGDALLARLDLTTGQITELGNLKNAAWDYQPASQPTNLAFFENHLYFIPNRTDDLVKVAVSETGLTAQSKAADLLANQAHLGDVAAVTVGPDGWLYLSRSDTPVLAKYDISTLSRYTVIKAAPGAGFHALTFDLNGQLYGTPAADAHQVWRTSEVDGTAAYQFDTQPKREIRDLTGLFETAPPVMSADTFAVDGTTSRLYRIDAATGWNQVLATTPWVADTIAFDNDRRRIYYLQRDGYTLGSYALDTKTHTVLGAINQTGLNVIPSSRPTSLTCFNGALYYIAPMTDDLIKIEIDSSGGLRQAYKAADVLNDAGHLGVVGALAVDGNGRLHIGSSTVFSSFDLRILGDYRQVAAAVAGGYDGLFFTNGGDLMGSRRDDLRLLHTVAPATGASLAAIPGIPLRRFCDFAAPQNRVPAVVPAGSYYAAQPSSPIIRELNLATGGSRILTWGARWNVGGLACDPENRVIYYSETPGGSTETRLGKYEIEFDRHTELGSMMAGHLGCVPSTMPKHLVFFAGDLYYVAPGTDDLVRVVIDTQKIVSASKIADLNGGSSLGDIGAAAVDNAGWMYVARQSGSLLARFNLLTRNQYTTLNTGSQSNYQGLTVDTANQLHGFPTAAPTVIHTVDASGVRTAKTPTTPSQAIWDITSSNPPPPPTINGHSYGVTGGNRRIYKFDPTTGATGVLTATAPFALSALARDPDREILYYLEEVTTGFRLGYYTQATGQHTTVGALDATTSGLAYLPSARPSNLFCYAGGIFYMASQSDDLVMVTLKDARITSQVKVADITRNARTFASIGDVAVDTTGRAFASASDGTFFSFDMKTLSGYTVHGSGRPAYDGLLFTEKAAFHGVFSSQPTTVQKTSTTTGSATFSCVTSPALSFIDCAGHETTTPSWGRSDSLWSLVPDTTGTANGKARLIEFKNYRTPGIEATDWGIVSYLDGGIAVAIDTEGLENLAITNDGTAYFVRNRPTLIGGLTRQKPLFQLDLGTRLPGTALTATFVGDLQKGLSEWITGASDEVTGLAISPRGQLHGVLRTGDTTTPDYLFTIANLLVDNTQQLINLLPCGSLQGPAGSATSADDIAFSADGILHVTDAADNHVYTVDPATGAIVTLVPSPAGTTSRALAINPSDNDLTVSDPSRQTIRSLDAAAAGGRPYFNYNELFGIPQIRAIAFFNGVFTPTQSTTRYFAANRTRQIHALDPATGSATLVTAGAPFAINALALETESNQLYYTEHAGTSIRLGRYTPTTNTHVTLGQLTDSSLNYRASRDPENLVSFGNDLYYVHSLTDDLVKIRVSATGIVSQEKVADLNAGNSLGTVRAAAINDAGQLIIAHDKSLSSYNIRTNNGFKTISNCIESYESLLWNSAGNSLHAASTAAVTRLDTLSISTGNATTGNRTTPTLELFDLTGPHTALPAPALAASLFAITGGNRTIHVVDPRTGVNSVLDASAPFNLRSLALDSENGFLYYTEDTTSTSSFRFGRYSLHTGEHTDLGSLRGGDSCKDPPSESPGNLAFHGGSVYYIPRNTDDLIQLTPSATGIASQSKVLDIRSNKAFTEIGDIAISQGGMMYFGEKIAGAPMYRLSVTGPNDFQSFGSSGRFLESSAIFEGTFYGASATGATTIDRYTTGTSALTVASGAATSPARGLTDMAGPAAAAVLDRSNSLWAIAGTPTGHLVEIRNHRSSQAAEAVDYGEIFYQDGTVTRSLTATGGTIKSLAITSTGRAFLTGPEPITLNGQPCNRPLFSIDLNRLTPGQPAMATCLGDLAAGLSPAAPLANTDHVTGLAVGPDGALYGVLNFSQTAATDLLFKLSSLRLNTARALTGLTAVGPITGAGLTCTGAADLAFAADGSLLVSDGPTGHVFTVNASTGAILSRHSTETGSHYPAIAVDPSDGAIVASNIAGTTDQRAFKLIQPGTTPDPLLWNYGTRFSWSGIEAMAFHQGNLTGTDDAFYAIAQTGRSLYSIDPLNGLTRVVSSSSPAVGASLTSLAYCAQSRMLYYTDTADSSGNFRLYQYNLDDGSHQLVGQLNGADPAGPITHPPANLVCLAGDLYFIARQSDDLVRIKLDAGAVVSIRKVADLSQNTKAFTEVGDLSVRADGVLFFNADAALWRFDLGGMNGLRPVASTSHDYWAVTFAAGNLVANRTASPASLRLVDTETAADSLLAATLPLINPVDFAATEPSVVLPSTRMAPYYGVNRTRTIFSVDPVTAATAVVTTAAPFALESIAFDKAAGVLYYIETGATTSRLGSYTLGTSTHAVLGDLRHAALAYQPAASPENLVFYNGSLYYIAPETDDLVRITLSQGTILSQEHADDLNDNLSFGVVRAAALDDTGLLYFNYGSTLARYDLRLGGLARVITTSTDSSHGLLWYPEGGRLASAPRSAPERLDAVSPSDGRRTNGPMTVPAVAFSDLASGSTATAPPGDRYFAVNRTATIYQIDPATGARTALPTAAGYALEAIACDEHRQLLYVVENTNTNTRLGQYDLATHTFRTIGNLASTQWAHVPRERPQHLAFHAGDLYYVNYDADTSSLRDDLIRIRFTDTAIVAQEKVLDLNGNAGLSRVTAAGVDDNGLLYLAAGSQLRRFNLLDPSGLTTLSSSSPVWSGLIWARDDGFLYGTNASTTTSRNTISRISATNGTATQQSVVTPEITGGIYDLAGGNLAPPHPSLNVPRAYIGGEFATAAGTHRNLARLASDGSLDPSFDPGTGANGPVRAVARQDDGRVIAGGEFTQFNGRARQGLARVHPDGSLDTTFTPQVLASGSQSATAPDWASWSSLVPNAPLNGTDTWTGARTPYFGLASATGGITGFGSQSWPNVNGSGVNMTLYYSQNMTETGGPRHGLADGPDLHGPTTAQTGGPNPDRRLTGAHALRLNSDRQGTPTPATMVISFSEPVHLDQAIVGSLQQLAGSAPTYGPNLAVNGSFENGVSWNYSSWFPSDTHPSRTPALINQTGSTSVSGWTTGTFHWVSDAGRSSNGSKMIYLNASDENTSRYLSQEWAVGAGASATTPLITNRTYRIMVDCVTFNAALPDGVNASPMTPALELFYQDTANVTRFSELNNLQDTSTGQPPENIPATSWNAPQWRTLSAHFTAPPTHSTSNKLKLWLSTKGKTEAIQPTSFMADYNVIVFENLSSSADIDGKAWIGGDLTATDQIDMGDDYTPNGAERVVVVGGAIQGGTSSSEIDIHSGSNAKLAVKDLASRGLRPIEWIDGGGQSTRLVIDPGIPASTEIMRNDLTARSQAYRQLPANSSMTGSSDTRRFVCVPSTKPDQTGIAVFHINAADLFGNGDVESVEISSSTGNSSDITGVIINVAGVNPVWTSDCDLIDNFKSTGWMQKIVWNFHEATTLDCRSQTMNGAVLAPLAAVTSSGRFEGSLVCRSLVLRNRCQRIPFTSQAVAGLGLKLGTSGMLFDNVRIQEVTASSGYFEHASVRAFSTPDATGVPVAADRYDNLSAQSEPLLGTSEDPVTVNQADSVRLDTDTSDGVYQTIGQGLQSDNKHGRVAHSFTTQPIRSLAVSFWTTQATEPSGGQLRPSFDGALTAHDSVFTFSLRGFTIAQPPAGKVYAIAQQPDGKILIGGEFGQVNGVAATNLARLHADGSVDDSFRPGQGPNGPVFSLALHPDGGALAGGSFSTWNGQASGNRLVRLTAQGARDTSFIPGFSSGTGDAVYWVKVDEASRIVAGGKFSAPRQGIVRLTATGTQDPSFNPGTGTGTGAVYAGLLEPTGAMVIGGDFTSIAGTTRSRAARLTASGAVDTSWNTGPGFDGVVQAMVQLNGASYIHTAGAFSSFQNSPRNKTAVIGQSAAEPGRTPWGPSSLTISRIWSID